MFGLAFGALSTLGTIGQFAGNLMGAAARQRQASEQIHGIKLQKASTVGLAAARSGASGVEGSSSSTMDYLRGLGAEFDRTIANFEETKKTDFITSLLGATSGLAGGAANTYTGMAQLNNWKW